MQLFVIIFMAIVGLASTAATIGLFALGHHNNWTSDGPGMLVVMLGVPFFGVIAFIARHAVWQLKRPR